LSVEELDRALAGADDLCRHAAETAATATTAAARSATVAAEATTASAATETIATATEALTAAEPIDAETALSEISARSTVRIEPVFTEPIALVASATPAASIVTHSSTRTFAPPPNSPMPTGRTGPGKVTSVANHAKCAGSPPAKRQP